MFGMYDVGRWFSNFDNWQTREGTFKIMVSEFNHFFIANNYNSTTSSISLLSILSDSMSFKVNFRV